MVELKGSLSDIGLAAVVQLISEVHHSGNLDLRKGSARGALAFDEGRLVAAECGQHHGLQALADCALELADGEFTFVEGAPPSERTLDLGPSDLKKLMSRITSGDFQALANGANGHAQDTQPLPETICPLLGFADDSARHYSRPTALHRCYASGAPALVTAQEQRDLCLSGQYASCPRYRDPSQAAAPVASPPPRREPEPQPQPDVPPGVAARLATRGRVRMAAEPQPAAAERRKQPAPPVTADEDDESTPAGRPTRGILLVVGGAVLGFLLVGVVMLLILPALRPSQQSSPAAFESIAQPTRAVPPAIPTPPPVVAPVSLSRATLVPTPTAIAQPNPTAQPRPAPLSQNPGRALMDVRFASGPARSWLDNPPYATWTDGAYRLHARDAGRFVAAGVPIDQVLSDVIVTATLRKTGGPPGGGYGLIVRDQGPEPRDGANQEMTAYVFETGDLGEYGVWRRDGDHWIDLVPWMRSASVRSGGSPNDLSVRATGTLLIFSVNGADVATVRDDALDAGGVGLFAGGDDNQVALDHFSVQLPN